jgi:hypothetical protein
MTLKRGSNCTFAAQPVIPPVTACDTSPDWHPVTFPYVSELTPLAQPRAEIRDDQWHLAHSRSCLDIHGRAEWPRLRAPQGRTSVAQGGTCTEPTSDPMRMRH